MPWPLYYKGSPPRTWWIGDWVGPRASLDNGGEDEKVSYSK